VPRPTPASLVQKPVVSVEVPGGSVLVSHPLGGLDPLLAGSAWARVRDTESGMRWKLTEMSLQVVSGRCRILTGRALPLGHDTSSGPLRLRGRREDRVVVGGVEVTETRAQGVEAGGRPGAGTSPPQEEVSSAISGASAAEPMARGSSRARRAGRPRPCERPPSGSFREGAERAEGGTDATRFRKRNEVSARPTEGREGLSQADPYADPGLSIVCRRTFVRDVL